MSAEAAQDGIVIRTATGDDLDGVVRVGHETWRATYEPIAGHDYVQMGLAKWWTPDAVIPGIRVGRTLVADDHGAVVGMASYGNQGEQIVLWKLYVLPGHQGKSVGRRLLDEVVMRATQLGHTTLHVSYIDGNEQARRFYERNGFGFVQREAGGSGMRDEIWLVKDLAGGQPRHDEGDRAGDAVTGREQENQ